MSIQKVEAGVYRARWIVAGVQRQETIRHKSNRQAERLARAAETRLREESEMGGYAPGRPSRMLFGDWLVQWARAEAPSWSASVRQKRLQRMAVWVEPFLAAVPLDQLTEPRLRSWHADASHIAAAKGSGATQVAHAWRDVSAALGAAHRDGLIPRNPALGALPRPRRRSAAPPPRRRTLTALEVERIRAQLGDQASRVLVGLLAYAGLRTEEAVALEWVDVGVDRIRVERAYTHGELRVTKTLAGRRSIPLVAPLADDLAALRELAADGLVVPAARGGYLDLHNWRARVWHPAREAAGVARATPYDLRHTYASLQMHSGAASALDVAHWMGHSRPSLVQDVYGHSFDDPSAARVPMVDAIADARRFVAAELRDGCAAASVGGADPVAVEART